jgi:phage baseplate assembly protein W
MVTVNRKIRNFKDISMSFAAHPITADVVSVSDENAVKLAVRNLILTKNYERPFHPEIGCQINSLLFENFTPITKFIMEQTIRDVIDKFEPRARITRVDVSDLPDENSVNVTVEFTLNNIERPITVTTILTRTR